MTSTKTLARANNIQIDMNGDVNDGITGLMIKLVRFGKPGVIPEEDLIRCRCVLRKNNTINNNISSDEINNNIATVDNMIETIFGTNAESPEIVNFLKDEMRKQMIMLMSRSLPWGELEKMKDNSMIEAMKRKAWNEEMNNKANNADAAE